MKPAKSKKKDDKEKKENDTENGKKSSQFAVITGASSGIGLELAKQFAKNGYDLLIVAQSEDIYDAEETLEDEYDIYVRSVRANLATFHGVEKLFKKIQAMQRPVDAIAINAGVGVSGDFSKDTDLYEELDMINLNITSVVHLSKLISREMVKSGKGKILLTSSMAALMPVTELTVYSATKAFVLSFSESLRESLKDSGITVTALMPGATDTDFFRRARMTEDDVSEEEKDDPADVAEKAYEALMAGKDHVITASEPLKMEGLLAKFIPELKGQGAREKTETGSAGESKH